MNHRRMKRTSRSSTVRSTYSCCLSMARRCYQPESPGPVHCYPERHGAAAARGGADQPGRRGPRRQRRAGAGRLRRGGRGWAPTWSVFPELAVTGLPARGPGLQAGRSWPPAGPPPSGSPPRSARPRPSSGSWSRPTPARPTPPPSATGGEVAGRVPQGAAAQLRRCSTRSATSSPATEVLLASFGRVEVGGDHLRGRCGSRGGRWPTAVAAGAEVVVSLNASPYAAGEGRAADRPCWPPGRSIIRGHLSPTPTRIGGRDALVFDGGSSGSISGQRTVARGKAFERGFGIGGLIPDAVAPRATARFTSRNEGASRWAQARRPAGSGSWSHSTDTDPPWSAA